VRRAVKTALAQPSGPGVPSRCRSTCSTPRRDKPGPSSRRRASRPRWSADPRGHRTPPPARKLVAGRQAADRRRRRRRPRRRRWQSWWSWPSCSGRPSCWRVWARRAASRFTHPLVRRLHCRAWARPSRACSCATTCCSRSVAICSRYPLAVGRGSDAPRPSTSSTSTWTPWELGKNYPASIAIQGDPKATLPGIDRSDPAADRQRAATRTRPARPRDAGGPPHAPPIATTWRRRAVDEARKSPMGPLALVHAVSAGGAGRRRRGHRRGDPPRRRASGTSSACADPKAFFSACAAAAGSAGALPAAAQA